MTYKYVDKEYERIPSEAICLGCDLYDARSTECLCPEDPDCMEANEDEGGTFFNHFQFKEIK
jgi:hypothetical protein